LRVGEGEEVFAEDVGPEFRGAPVGAVFLEGELFGVVGEVFAVEVYGALVAV
jgi:hypothetical protein